MPTDEECGFLRTHSFFLYFLLSNFVFQTDSIISWVSKMAEAFLKTNNSKLKAGPNCELKAGSQGIGVGKYNRTSNVGKYALQLKAHLENVTSLKPEDEDIGWHLKLKCTRCDEVSPKWHCVSPNNSSDLKTNFSRFGGLAGLTTN